MSVSNSSDVGSASQDYSKAMLAYVSEHLEDEVRLGLSSASETMSQDRASRVTSVATELDPEILNEMEASAMCLSQNVQRMLMELQGTVHSVSQLSSENVAIYADAAAKSCDNIDSAIKTIYQLIAKVEELTYKLRHLPRVAQQIREMKRVLDLFDMHLSKSHG